MLSSMPAAPHTLYRQFLATQGADTDEIASKLLRRTLRQPRDSWPAGLKLLMESSAVSPGYVTRHLLSIRTFSPDVMEALEAGLPLAVCRLVNGLDSDTERTEALAPLWHAASSTTR